MHRTIPPHLRFVDLRHTTAFRITAGLCAVFVIAVIGLLGLVYVTFTQQLYVRIDGELRRAAEPIAAHPARAVVTARRAIDASTSGFDAFALYGADGRRIVGNIAISGRYPVGVPFERACGGPTRAPIRLLALPVAGVGYVVVGHDVALVRDLRLRVLHVMAVAGLVVIFASVLAGAALSLGPIRRIQRVQALAAEIAGGALSQRLPLDGPADEISAMAAIINSMVEEIERLVAQVKGASDAIAHDMRTPLTHLRARLDRIGQVAEDPALRGDLYDAIGELDATLARFRALLRISEIDAQRRLAGVVPLDPAEVVQGVAELYDPLAEDKGLSLRVSTAAGARIAADESLLFEAVSNLVDNAIKFAPLGSVIDLTLVADDGGVAIAVRDRGAGIVPGERERVLRRFERGAGAAMAPGSGLGLSLVAAIAQLHGFALSLEDAGPGLRVRLVAPLA